MISEIFTVQQAARYLQIDSDLVLRKVRAGEIPAAKVAGEWRLRRARIDRWLDEMSDFSDPALNKLLRDTRRAAKRAGIKAQDDIDRLVTETRTKRKQRKTS
ncbi:helix-turn-helix domain-containing protein [candidate division KSB1 bacterium]|nr:helix-turn-helix domain-containing protein [candidate division KSB1 bacterium]